MSNFALRGMRVHATATMIFSVVLLCTNAGAHAINWDRVNAVDADTLALYHFDNATADLAPVESPLNAGLDLAPSSALAPITVSSDVVSGIFAPQSIRLMTTQTLQSTSALTDVSGDLTIEFWFKWLPTMTSSTLQVGLGSGARVLLARDVLYPVNDRFGVGGGHGTFRSAPGFVDWPSVGEEHADLNTWYHIGLAIHSTGIVYDEVSGHDAYAAGSVARMYLHGHAVGIPVTEIDLGGMQVHNSSRVTVRIAGAGVALDELAIWKKDWTANGTNPDPFGDGRGGDARVENALEY